ILDRPPRATALLERGGELGEWRTREPEAGDDRDPGALATLGLAGDADDPVAARDLRLGGAGACREGAATGRAGAAQLGGVHEPATSARLHPVITSRSGAWPVVTSSAAARPQIAPTTLPV